MAGTGAGWASMVRARQPRCSAWREPGVEWYVGPRYPLHRATHDQSNTSGSSVCRSFSATRWSGVPPERKYSLRAPGGRQRSSVCWGQKAPGLRSVSVPPWRVQRLSIANFAEGDGAGRTVCSAEHTASPPASASACHSLRLLSSTSGGIHQRAESGDGAGVGETEGAAALHAADAMQSDRKRMRRALRLPRHQGARAHLARAMLVMNAAVPHPARVQTGGVRDAAVPPPPPRRTPALAPCAAPPAHPGCPPPSCLPLA